MTTAFAARDILGNILSGLSVQISQPFSIGDTIKVRLLRILVVIGRNNFFSVSGFFCITFFLHREQQHGDLGQGGP